MKRHHPVIAEWIAQRARMREALIQGGRVTAYRGWFNNLDHRRHRILDQIFYKLEVHGLLPKSNGHPHFHFEYQGQQIHCALALTRDRISGTDKRRTALHFDITNPVLGPAPIRQHMDRWTDASGEAHSRNCFGFGSGGEA
jgi:hypothetical protein